MHQAPPAPAAALGNLEIEEEKTADEKKDAPAPAPANPAAEPQHPPQKMDPGFRMILCFLTVVMLIFTIVGILMATVVDYDQPKALDLEDFLATIEAAAT